MLGWLAVRWPWLYISRDSIQYVLSWSESLRQSIRLQNPPNLDLGSPSVFYLVTVMPAGTINSLHFQWFRYVRRLSLPHELPWPGSFPSYIDSGTWVPLCCFLRYVAVCTCWSGWVKGEMEVPVRKFDVLSPRQRMHYFRPWPLARTWPMTIPDPENWEGHQILGWTGEEMDLVHTSKSFTKSTNSTGYRVTPGVLIDQIQSFSSFV